MAAAGRRQKHAIKFMLGRRERSSLASNQVHLIGMVASALLTTLASCTSHRAAALIPRRPALVRDAGSCHMSSSA